jgi:hypothetical protein
MIENLGNIGDFVGGVGVFITLIYLARSKIILSTSLSHGLWDKRLKNSCPVDFHEFVDRQIHV